MGDLLEVFDGVLEMKGRMMVVTTNHPEKLDPALNCTTGELVRGACGCQECAKDEGEECGGH